MARIEDYALIGDCEGAALVSREGSIDWLCLPRFDSAACCAALLGTPENGRWLLTPTDPVVRTTRNYRGDTLVLETHHETTTGAVTVIDFMPVGSLPARNDLVRIVVGRRGRVAMRTDLVLRFDYGWTVPWVRRENHGYVAIAGPDTLHITADVPLRGENMHTVGEFTICEGETRALAITWHRSHDVQATSINPVQALDATERWWTRWAAQCTYDGPWRPAVMRSLITLKALTYAPTGGIVAAPTTSLPEALGGVRNWDYRYCWLRDATYTLYALMSNGFFDEARAWREWLLRAVAGRPSQVQIMYGIAGERRLPELELPWLAGYEGSAPVRIGNAASDQFQLDIFGEIADALHHARRFGLDFVESGWKFEQALLEYLETVWHEPDEGIWEVRGGRRHFTHSKVMAWVAFDRAARDIEHLGLDGPGDRWRAMADRIHAEICREGFNAERGSFAQYYGGRTVDASLLLLPLVGFLPIDDPRIEGTVAAIERDLLHDGLVYRYRHEDDVDGLPPGEGAFILCSFWLADVYGLQGRRREAQKLFERLLSLRNDVGLLAEQYDPHLQRQLGNFPQAFSHIGLVNTARNLSAPGGPAEDRQRG
ncbi:MAG: glycoside hydrolase family 15 protein [Acidobacteriota bacterium]|jgi:GH15 family glucan-1,4-alpha-glucosidase|nr:MAG: glucoamylase [Acidobacteriota bacterium]